MSHYEERLETDLKRIRERLSGVGSHVEAALKDAVHALLTGNGTLAYATVLGDHPINRDVRRLDKLCHGFIALHLPSAGHLRLISSVMRIGIALERIGDYAVTICRESVQLPRPPEGALAREVELMADESRQMLHQAMDAFNEGNADMAKATMAMADQVERTFATVFEGLVSEQGDWTVKDLFALLVVFHTLERVSDQAKNICEETVFAVSGETKAPKVYRILFLDEDDSCLAPMAEAIARKSFPHSGHYASAGRTAAGGVSGDTVAFLSQHGIDLSGFKPHTLEATPEELTEYHVIVSLKGPVKSYVGRVPFHTTALEWDVGEVPEENGEATKKRLEEIYREIALQVRDLMETLRGEEAS